MRSKAAIFGSAFVIGLSGAMVPGPLLTASVSYSLEQGFWAGGPQVVLGHALLEGALVVLVLAGLGPVLARPKVGAVIGVGGGAVLLWMGYGMVAWAAGGSASMSSGASGAAPPLHPVVGGFLITLANPYWSLWWATIGLKYIALSRQAGRSGVVTFFVGHELADVAWYFSIAGAAALGRTAISGAPYRWLVGACGVVLLGFGVGFLVAGGRVLLPKRKPEPSAEGEPGPAENLKPEKQGA